MREWIFVRPDGFESDAKHDEYCSGELIRCKDCKHSRIEGDTTRFWWCGYWNKPTDERRYCSDGERKE